LFAYKLKQGIEIPAPIIALYKIQAYGSELNQVWTNLLDNAIDAISGQALSKLLPLAILTIFKFKSPILVQAFLLTFNPASSSRSLPQNCWQGSGLGLEMVRRIVENRHRSSITFIKTGNRFTVHPYLPLNVQILTTQGNQHHEQ